MVLLVLIQLLTNIPFELKDSLISIHKVCFLYMKPTTSKSIRRIRVLDELRPLQTLLEVQVPTRVTRRKSLIQSCHVIRRRIQPKSRRHVILVILLGECNEIHICRCFGNEVKDLDFYPTGHPELIVSEDAYLSALAVDPPIEGRCVFERRAAASLKREGGVAFQYTMHEDMFRCCVWMSWFDDVEAIVQKRDGGTLVFEDGVG